MAHGTFPIHVDSQMASSIMARRLRDKNYIAKLLKEASANKPSSRFDLEINAIRNAYEGNQAARTRQVLAGRYRAAGRKMHPLPLNITRETGELDAQAYRRAPVRELVARDDGEVDPDRAAAFDEMLRRSRINVVLREMERRAMVAKSIFMKVRWSQIEGKFGREQRPEFALFWPSNVHIIRHAQAPARLWAASIVILDLEGSGADQVREYWIRDDDNRWSYGRYTDEGRAVLPMRPYEEPDLPIIAMHDRMVELDGALFVYADRDLINLQDEVNVRRSDDAYRSAMEAHKQLWITGSQSKEGEHRAVGPGIMLEIPEPDATIGAIEAGYDERQLQGVQRLLEQHGKAYRHTEIAWKSESGNPASGAAWEVKTKAADEKRDDHAELFETDFEPELLRLLSRITDRWGDLGTKIDGEDIVYRSKFPEAEKFVDPEARRLTAEGMQRIGWLSPAAAAVRGGAYETLKEAVAAGLSEVARAEEPRQTATPPASDRPPAAIVGESLRQRLRAVRSGPPNDS